MRALGILWATAAASLVSFSAAAQQMKAVEGLVINIGIVQAIAAEHAEQKKKLFKYSNIKYIDRLEWSIINNST